jgi:hypothetical protein
MFTLSIDVEAESKDCFILQIIFLWTFWDGSDCSKRLLELRIRFKARPPNRRECFNLKEMVQDRMQPAKRPLKRSYAPAFLSLTALLCVGCASPGPPKPPSLHLPQLVKDLSAARIGGHVLLRWTTPSRTTDDMDIKGALTAELCREADPKPSTPAARLTACAPVRRLPVVPGPSEVTDTLPAALQADPVVLLTYRIQIFNSTGHSAGESTVLAYAAAGQAPAAVASLQATAAEQGAILEWHSAAPQGSTTELIDLKRIDLSAPPSEKKAKPATIQTPKRSKSSQPKSAEEHSNEVHLRASGTAASPTAATTGTVDTTATMGETYTYTAHRIRAVTLAGRQLEIQSDPSSVVTLVMRDTFPPKVPTGLATISGASAGANAGPYIDLSWEPNSESDLAGYRVYRQLARPDGSPQGPLARLTAVPIAVPAYRDVAVAAGQGYIYSVTAVDAAGNESAPSAKALEVVEPSH